MGNTQDRGAEVVYRGEVAQDLVGGDISGRLPTYACCTFDREGRGDRKRVQPEAQNQIILVSQARSDSDTAGVAVGREKMNVIG